MRRGIGLLVFFSIVGLWTGLASVPRPSQAALAANCAGTATGLVPLTELGTAQYKGSQGGLYPAGSNNPPRADGLVWRCEDFADDGTHPSPSGRHLVAGLLLTFFKSDATTRSWFMADPAATPAPVPTFDPRTMPTRPPQPTGTRPTPGPTATRPVERTPTARATLCVDCERGLPAYLPWVGQEAGIEP